MACRVGVGGLDPTSLEPTHGANDSTRPAATALRAICAAQARLAFSPPATARRASPISAATCGNGPAVSMSATRTIAGMAAKTPRLARAVWFAAGPGSASRGSAVLRSVTSTSPTSGTSTLAFVAPEFSREPGRQARAERATLPPPGRGADRAGRRRVATRSEFAGRDAMKIRHP